MIKTTGVEFKRFYNDSTLWPRSVWHEDEELLVNGADPGDLPYDHIPDDAEVRITGGGVFGLPDNKKISFESFFRAWKKRETMRTLVVECPADQFEAVKAAIQAAGGVVR